MNFESAKSEPELFINEVSQSVEYFDVTNCNSKFHN